LHEDLPSPEVRRSGEEIRELIGEWLFESAAIGVQFVMDLDAPEGWDLLMDRYESSSKEVRTAMNHCFLAFTGFCIDSLANKDLKRKEDYPWHPKEKCDG